MGAPPRAFTQGTMDTKPLRLVRHYEPDPEAMLAALAFLLEASLRIGEDAVVATEAQEMPPGEEVDEAGILLGTAEPAEGAADAGV